MEQNQEGQGACPRAVTCPLCPLPCSFTQAMLSQPRMESLNEPAAWCLGLLLLGGGTLLVLSSFFALGFTGTFLGKTRGWGELEQAHWGPRMRGALWLSPAICDIPWEAPGTQLTPSSTTNAESGLSMVKMGGWALLSHPAPGQ